MHHRNIKPIICAGIAWDVFRFRLYSGLCRGNREDVYRENRLRNRFSRSMTPD